MLSVLFPVILRVYQTDTERSRNVIKLNEINFTEINVSKSVESMKQVFLQTQSFIESQALSVPLFAHESTLSRYAQHRSHTSSF